MHKEATIKALSYKSIIEGNTLGIKKREDGNFDFFIHWKSLSYYLTFHNIAKMLPIPAL